MWWGGIIEGQCQLKLKWGKEANSITETVVLKVRKPNKIRALYRAICAIPENLEELY